MSNSSVFTTNAEDKWVTSDCFVQVLY